MTRHAWIRGWVIVAVVLGIAVPDARAAIGDIELTSPVAVPNLGMTGVGVSGSGHLTRATIFGDDAASFQFVGLCGDPRDCVFTVEHPLPDSFDVTCTNPGPTTLTTSLRVTNETSMRDGTLTCEGVATTDPRITVSPLTVQMPDTPVDATSMAMPLVITNVGGGAQPLTFQVGNPGPEWAIDECVATPCSLAAGDSQQLLVRFTPAEVGDRSVTIFVTSTDAVTPTVAVMLRGAGQGGTLQVDHPASPDYVLDFGTIGRNQAVTLPVDLRNTGTSSITLTLAPPGVPTPFTLSTTTLAVAPGPASFDVTCESQMAGDYSGRIGITSDAVTQATDSITALCTVAPTDVQVTPAQIDFGEVRIGAAPMPQLVTITNPSPVPVMLTGVRLAMAPLGLALVAPDQQSIPAAGSVVVMVTLATDHEVMLDGATLVIDVDGTELVRPITGRVVTPAAHVEPGMLDLGTVCVGGQASGALRLVNDGTATLKVQSPTVMGGFTAITMGGPFPADLPARMSITTTVTPSSSTLGVVRGTLAWDVDAPNGPFQVDLRVEYITMGTAVSPRALTFESTPVGTITPTRMVTLENCSPDPTDLDVSAVVATQGHSAVWLVDSLGQTTTLDPGERFTIAIAFAPDQPGAYSASLRLVVDGAPQAIALTGVATGEPIETTSFYACNCSTGTTSPTGAWPIVLALLAVVSRGRSGWSSARRRTRRSRSASCRSAARCESPPSGDGRRRTSGG